MVDLTYRAHALGPLGNVAWTVPGGVSVVVGPNRVGKSTLLKLPEFIRLAVQSDLDVAVREMFKGSAYLRNFNAPASAQSSVGLTVGQIAWTVDLTPTGGSVASLPTERVYLGEKLRMERKFGADSVVLDDGAARVGTSLIPKFCLERFVASYQRGGATDEFFREQVEMFPASDVALGGAVASYALRSRAYRTYEYMLSHLLRYGSPQSPDLFLQPTGENVFPLLRNWRDRSDLEARAEFVFETLREAFPHVHKLDFETAGQTVTVSVVDGRWKGRKTPIAYESTGLVTALLQLCAVASGDKNGIVTIDELETSLHPHAIRVLIAAFRRWAREHEMRIVLATQSETVLDQFRDEPEKIFVIESNQETSPQPLTELFGREWLSQFSLGDLFSHLEFGRPDVPSPG